MAAGALRATNTWDYPTYLVIGIAALFMGAFAVIFGGRFLDFTKRQGGLLTAVAFESVNHRATVWIDGRLVTRHTGVYLPFEARTRLAAGRHTLVVRADWSPSEGLVTATALKSSPLQS